jgi:D-alanyl-lipoteichoic acid acyltransferase DltB (MBOAT superfamily)
MLFNTAPFFLFLAVVLILFYGSPRPLRRYILLAASYYFYGSWNVKFIPLLLTLTVIDFTAGILLEKARPERRKLVLILSLSANLGFLGFFKYFNFLGANLAWMLGRPPKSFWFDIVLPLGISFHTFQSMSYVIDVYRGQQKAIRDPIDYALFICFFPQLVAGPIVRARDFFRDLLDWHPPTPAEVYRGLFLIALGLAKKMAFADRFAIVADAYFKDVANQPGRITAWCGVFAFAMQIYFDFSGYTDMAIGMARLLGFHFPINFRRPYLAASITEFWRRWHISLSTWLRDYLYIPLGGNRHGVAKTYRNLMLTMLLGGLWHGASWNFVVWGGYHGAWLAIERALLGDRAADERRHWFYPLQAVCTLVLVMISWVFFRAADLPESLHVLGQMIHGGPGKNLFEPWHWGLLGVALLLALVEEHLHGVEHLLKAPVWVYASAIALILFTVEIFGVIDRAIPFVYFQF